MDMAACKITIVTMAFLQIIVSVVLTLNLHGQTSDIKAEIISNRSMIAAHDALDKKLASDLVDALGNIEKTAAERMPEAVSDRQRVDCRQLAPW